MQVTVADSENDAVLAGECTSSRGYAVLGYDSDFTIYPCPAYIPFNTLTFSNRAGAGMPEASDATLSAAAATPASLSIPRHSVQITCTLYQRYVDHTRPLMYHPYLS